MPYIKKEDGTWLKIGNGITPHIGSNGHWYIGETDTGVSAVCLYTDEEKAKLESIEEGANKYTLPVATDKVLGGIKVGNNLEVAADGTLSATIPQYAEATTSKSGLLSSTDKTKLDTIAENAEANVQSNWTEDDNTDDSFIKNKPFKTISTDDFTVDSNILKLSDNKVNSIRTLGLTNVQADQFLKISEVDSNGIPTAFSTGTLSGEFISSKGGTYDFGSTNTLVINTDRRSPSLWSDFLTIKGGKNTYSGTTYDYTVSLTPWSLSLLYEGDNKDGNVGSALLPNIWQILDDEVAGDHKKLYIRSSSIQFWCSNNGWKKFYIQAEKDKTLIYNDQKLIDFNTSRLANVATPTEDTDATNKKYVDDLTNTKVNTSQGTDNAGKILEVGNDGNLVLTDKPSTYTLPTAADSRLGGVKAESATTKDTQPVRIGSDGKLYTAPASLPDEVTTTKSGLMTSDDKTKLNNISDNAASIKIKIWTTADITK